MNELADKIVVVTGAGSGIGRATALELARAGANVIVHTRRSQDAVQRVADEIGGQGRHAHWLLADLADPREQDRLAQEAWSWRGGVDVWINNAGADVLTADAASWPYEQKLETVWRVDVVATIRLTREIGARMQTRGQGTIVNVGWDQAAQGMAGDSGEIFAAAKGAVMSFTKSAALSLAPHVRVNCVAPGWIKTAWGENASAEWQDRARRESQLGRWGTPEDVAKAIRFLASNQSGFVDGQVLNVNGGYRPR